MTARAILRSDGGARGNPGPAGAGFVIHSNDGTLLSSGGRFLGDATNNIAEYEALIWGLETARDLGITQITVLCDSELVVRQVNGVYKVKHPNMRPLFVRALGLLREFASFEVRHIPRAENAAADKLVNEAIDLKSHVGHAGAAHAAEPRSRQDTLFD
jgi:ribonuclease HI